LIEAIQALSEEKKKNENKANKEEETLLGGKREI